MLRLWTQVTVSPTVSRRSWSASSATASTSGPRASNSVTISSMPTSWPARTPARTSATAPADLRAAARARHERRRADRRAGVPRRRLVADEDDLGAVAGVAGAADALREVGARVVAPEALGVGAVEDREAQRRVEPAVGLQGPLGVDRQAGGQREAAGLGDVAQAVEVGPRALRVDVVGGDGGDAAPVVDAGVEEGAEVVAQVGRGLEVDVGREDQAGGGDRPQVVVGRAGRRVAHDGQRLGQEVLDDDLLHVTVAGVAVGDGPQGVEAVLAALADADQDPGRERDGQLAGGLQRRQPTLGGLVGRVAVAVEVAVERLQHHPLAGRHRAQLGQLVGVEGAGVGVGEQAGLLEHELAHRRQVADGGVVAVLAQPVAGDVVAQLGALAEREQRLVAAGAGAGLGDPEHLRRAEVRARRRGPAAGRTCSSRSCRGRASSAG